MERFKTLYLLIFALLISLTSYSQEELTSIQKNVNREANGLEQHLNATRDTLTLKSDLVILRVTFLSHSEKDSEIIDVGNNEIKIPLYHFKKGRYTIAVYREDKIIALGVKRINDIPVPEDAIADLEESILRSSLSAEEQLNRNIKPLVKKTRNTRLASTKPKVKTKKRVEKTKRVAAAKPKRVLKPKTKRKQKKKRYTSSNKKTGFALAAEREAATAKKKAITKVIEKENKEEEVNAAIASNNEQEVGTLITVTKVTYNLSQRRNNKSIQKQSREDYRANNLRPNGTPYQD
ncbi:hypothetical protein [uncultured Lacinutrix sp.]|uniref:hypothetical protein n=1 Tax=uncultured Lacinutrix sp. TaxID=574032 RepID=UPI0026354A05|nr:hypothetical protein [uncultured Lacinutrix sp.]